MYKALQASLGSQRQNSFETTFWIQVLENIRALAIRSWRLNWRDPLSTRKAAGIRDNQMAQNLAWLTKERYRGRKIIVWAATAHNARNLRYLEVPPEEAGLPPHLQDYYNHIPVMGDHLWKSLGKKVYSLGFTAYSGMVGNTFGKPHELPPASHGSLEDLLFRAGFQNAFVNFQNLPASGNWLADEVRIRPLGNVEMNGKWTKVLDGIMFTKDMIPSTRIEQ